MISIIVCSRYKTPKDDFALNIKSTIGVEYEVIHIDNSENIYSIFSAYNEGIKRSSYSYLCFIHDDIKFHTSDWGGKIVKWLDIANTGIVGIGGSVFLPKVPCTWSTLEHTCVNVIQSDRNNSKPSARILKPKNSSKKNREVVMLDGVFLAMKKDIFSSIQFDENLSGFHGYDYDICIQAHIAGFRNYVIYDIDIEHFSRGKTTIRYFRNLIHIFKKWENSLPVMINEHEAKLIDQLPEIEKNKTYQLTKKMARKGFDVSEIKNEILYFCLLTGNKRPMLFLGIRVNLIRLFNVPKYLLRSKRVLAQCAD